MQASKARAMPNSEFFAPQPKGYMWSAEFKQLDHITRREIVADKLGVDWQTYRDMPLSSRRGMWAHAAGMTYGAGLDQGHTDMRAASIRGFFAGFGFAGRAVLLLAAAGLLFFFRDPIISSFRKLKAA